MKPSRRTFIVTAATLTVLPDMANAQARRQSPPTKPEAPPGITLNVWTRSKKIIREHLGVEDDKITMTARFIEDLGADSLDLVELVMAAEEDFNLEIPDDAAEEIGKEGTVGAAVRFIQKNI